MRSFIGDRTFWLNLGWLVVLVVTFAVPLTLDAVGRLIEAAFVWLAAPFACILTYEFAKALAHHPRPTRVALLGRDDGRAGVRA